MGKELIHGYSVTPASVEIGKSCHGNTTRLLIHDSHIWRDDRDSDHSSPC